MSVRPNPERMPHLPRDFAGQPEDLIMVRDRADGRREVLRLWATGMHLGPEAVPVWVGQVRIEAVDDLLGLFNRWRPSTERAPALRALRESLAPVEPTVVGDRALWLISAPQSVGSSSSS